MQTEFIEKLERIQTEKNSNLALFVNPQIVKMPLPMKRHDDPFLPFGKEIVRQTRDLVTAYVFDLSAYLAIGAAGAIALERTLSYAVGDSVLILHGPFAGSGFVGISDENAFVVDAVTLAQSRHLDLYLRRGDRSAFVLRDGAANLNDAPRNGGFYWYEARRFTTLGSKGQVITLEMFGEEMLYADSSADYAINTRRMLEQMLHDR